MRRKLQKKMFNENDLEDVYVLGQTSNDQKGEDTEESDTEHEQRYWHYHSMMRFPTQRIYDK